MHCFSNTRVIKNHILFCICSSKDSQANIGVPKIITQDTNPNLEIKLCDKCLIQSLKCYEDPYKSANLIPSTVSDPSYNEKLSISLSSSISYPMYNKECIKCDFCENFCIYQDLDNFPIACEDCVDKHVLNSEYLKNTFNCPNCMMISKIKLTRSCEHLACEKCMKLKCSECETRAGFREYHEENKGLEDFSMKSEVSYEREQSFMFEKPMQTEHQNMHLVSRQSWNSNIEEDKEQNLENFTKTPYISRIQPKPCELCMLRSDKLYKIHISESNDLKNNFQHLECGHKICTNCYRKNNQCLCLENRKKIYFENTDMPNWIQNISNQRETAKVNCCSCKKLTSNYLRVICGHKMCHDCNDLSKNCQICSDIISKCSFCNIETQLTILNCQHIMCIKCLSEQRECQKCIETNQKSTPCYINIPHFCPNCGEKADELLDFKCNHQGCYICINNFVCFKCAYEKRYKILLKSSKKICNFCKKAKEHSISLRCYDVICITCLKKIGNRIIDLNYSCLRCIKSDKLYNQICSNCHKETFWARYQGLEKIYMKRCCNKKICLKCLRVQNDVKHKCEKCEIF